MSIETLAIVLHHSKASGTDKVIALGIANHDGDLGAYPGIPTLARYANVSESTAREAVRRLEACPDAGACPEAAKRKDKACPHLGEVKVHIGAGPVMPNGGRTNRYDVLVECPPECDRSKNHKVKETPTGPPVGVDNSTPTGPPVPPPTGPPVGNRPRTVQEPPPTPAGPPAIPESVARVWGGEGFSIEEQREMWASLLADPETRAASKRAIQPAYYIGEIAKIRARTGKARGAMIEQVRRYGEPCEHDMPGGADIHPLTDEPYCPICRAKARHHL